MWLNADTKQIVKRVSPRDMERRYGGNWDHPFVSPPAPWIADPDLSAVVGWDTKYWIVQRIVTPGFVVNQGQVTVGDTGLGIPPVDPVIVDAITANVTLMDQTARDQVDATNAAERLDSVANRVDNTEDIMRAVLKLMVDEFNRHALRINAIKAAVVDGQNMADIKAAMAAVPDMPDRTFNDLKQAIRNALGS